MIVWECELSDLKDLGMRLRAFLDMPKNTNEVAQ